MVFSEPQARTWLTAQGCLTWAGGSRWRSPHC